MTDHLWDDAPFVYSYRALVWPVTSRRLYLPVPVGGWPGHQRRLTTRLPPGEIITSLAWPAAIIFFRSAAPITLRTDGGSTPRPPPVLPLSPTSHSLSDGPRAVLWPGWSEVTLAGSQSPVDHDDRNHLLSVIMSGSVDVGHSTETSFSRWRFAVRQHEKVGENVH